MASAAKAFNVSILFKAETAAAKSAIADMKQELNTFPGAAGTAAAGAETLAAATDRQGAAAQAAAAAMGVTRQAAAGLQAANSTLVPSTNTMTAALQAQETAMQRSVAAFAGLQSASASATSDNLRYGMALDALRARFNPLFAASRQYEMVLRDIAEAERLGAISAAEAAAARQREAHAMLAPVSSQRAAAGGAGAAGAYAANLSFQMNDVVMMTAMGQSPFMLMMQQGPQVAQIFGQMKLAGVSMGAALRSAFGMMLTPWGLVSMAVIGGGAALVQWLTSAGEEAKSFEEHLDDLDGTLGRLKSSLDILGDLRLGESFGSMTADVRALSQGLLDLDRASQLQTLQRTLETFAQSQIEDGWVEWIGRRLMIGPGASPAQLDRVSPMGSASANYDELGAANTYEDFAARTEQLRATALGGDVEGVIRQIGELASAMTGGGSVSEMNPELRAVLTELMQSGINTARVEAMFNGSAQREALDRQVGQMERGWRQEAELAEASVRYGERSAEVERLRAEQAREALRVRLEELGVTQESAEGRRAQVALERQLEAQAQQAAGARRREVDQLVQSERSQAEIAAAILRYGADSLQVERLRAEQARAALALRLREMGVAEDSAEAEAARVALAERLRVQEATLLDARRQRVREELAGIAAVAREIELLGASNAERGRANALAEAEAEIQRRRLGWLEAILLRTRAIARADAEARLERERALQSIRTGTAMDAYDAAIAEETNPFARAELQARREYAQQIAAGADADVAAAAATRTRASALGDLAREQRSYLRQQAEGLRMQQLELDLMGRSEATRARVLALVRAEQDIRRLGMQGEQADSARRNALAQVDLAQMIERQADAWNDVYSAGRNALDGLLDRLRAGDIEGAIEELASGIVDTFFDLSIRNPLQNALFGSNLGTMADVGGIAGIWGRLTGRDTVDEAGLASAAVRSMQSVSTATMSVTATHVMISGATRGFLAGGLADPVLPTSGAAGLASGPSAEAAAVLQSVAQMGAARPDGISGLAAALADPLSAMIIEAQSRFGAGAVSIFSGYRSNETQARLWQEALQRYGSPDAARQWVAPPGRSRHNFGLAADLRFATPEVQDWMHQNAGRFGLGFRMGHEPWHIEPNNASALIQGQAQAFPVPEFQQLGQAVTTAATQVAGLGSQAGETESAFSNLLTRGLGPLGQAGSRLTTAAAPQSVGSMQVQAGQVMVAGGMAAGGGAGGGFLSSLLSFFLPGFDRGGATGGSSPSEVRGVVHGMEYVFDAASTARIGVGTLDALRRGALKGYREGGYVSSTAPALFSSPAPALAANSGMAPSINMPVIVNNFGQDQVEARQESDGRGGRQMVMTIGEGMAAAVRQPGNPARKSLVSDFNLRPRAVRR